MKKNIVLKRADSDGLNIWCEWQKRGYLRKGDFSVIVYLYLWKRLKKKSLPKNSKEVFGQIVYTFNKWYWNNLSKWHSSTTFIACLHVSSSNWIKCLIYCIFKFLNVSTICPETYLLFIGKLPLPPVFFIPIFVIMAVTFFKG